MADELPRGAPGLASELDVKGGLLPAPVDDDGDRVAGLVRRDQVAQLVERRDGCTVGGDHDVPAEDVALAGEDDLGRPGPEPRPGTFLGPGGLK